MIFINPAEWASAALHQTESYAPCFELGAFPPQCFPTVFLITDYF